MLDDTLKTDPTTPRRLVARSLRAAGYALSFGQQDRQGGSGVPSDRTIEPEAAPVPSVEIIDTYLNAHNLKAALQEADAALKKFPEDRGSGGRACHRPRVL